MLHVDDLVLHFSSHYLYTCFYTICTTPTHLPVSQSTGSFRTPANFKNLAADKLKPEPGGTVGDLS